MEKNQKMNKTNDKSVVFVADNNYVLQFLVTLSSLVHHVNNKDLNVYLITCGLSKANEAYIKKWSSVNSIEVHLCHVDVHELDWLIPYENAWSRFMFLKLYIPYVIPNEVRRILYLDVDILVTSSIAKLFELDIYDYALAAVEDTPDCIMHKKRCGIPKESPYINSGVMVINMDKWRTAANANLFWTYIRNNTEKGGVNDQDVINTVFQNQICLLPLRYNVTNHCFGFHPNLLPVHLQQLEDAYYAPIIIHFTNWNKPWIGGTCHKFKSKWLEEMKRVKEETSIAMPQTKRLGIAQMIKISAKYYLWRVYIFCKYRR